MPGVVGEVRDSFESTTRRAGVRGVYVDNDELGIPYMFPEEEELIASENRFDDGTSCFSDRANMPDDAELGNPLRSVSVDLGVCIGGAGNGRCCSGC
jgi:hypothetical protein